MSVKNSNQSLYRATKTLVIRNLKLSFRTPGTFALALVMPASMLVVFVYAFGGAMNVGEGNFIDYIVPGIILVTIGQFAPSVSVRLSNDMTNGIIDRFRTLPISNASILLAHVTSSILQNVFTVTITMGTAILLGFRPTANFKAWMIIILLVILYIKMIMWLATLNGILAKTPESSSDLMLLISALPFLSSAFVPIDTMPPLLRIFAENQPMTPILDSLRSLLLSEDLTTRTIQLAFFWGIGLTILFGCSSIIMYKIKMKRD